MTIHRAAVTDSTVMGPPLPDLTGLPRNFVFGVATSSYQIEGDLAGRGRANWDDFCAEPGRIVDGSDGSVACDHVARMKSDVTIMASLGVQAYRFSICWPRVLPKGVGKVSELGLGFYDRLVDELLTNGIAPWATMYHWDLPSALEARGGWRNRDVASWFGEYSTVVGEKLADRVTAWSTLNEPWCTTFLGHQSGAHAPGRQNSAEALATAHHQLLAHAQGMAALRAAGATQVGICLNHWEVLAAPGADDDPVVVDALRRMDAQVTRMWVDPLLRGRYPDDVLEDLGDLLIPVIKDGDLAAISAPMDWWGLNYYFDPTFRASAPGEGNSSGHGRADAPSPFIRVEGVVQELDGPLTDMGWPITPSGLTRHLLRLQRDYGDAMPPLVISENGVAFSTGISADGAIHDVERRHYLHDHIEALTAAVRAGVDVRGYLQWSLMDNFEWAEGYRMRFGIVGVDFDTQVRTIKDSGAWYRRVIAAHKAG